MRNFGVHSEVGKLRTVMVCRPGLAHQRLTPGNCHDLLFDDVVWVHEAQKDHYDFVLKMRERGVEVLELHDLLAVTLERKEARDFVLDRRITAHAVGLGTAQAMRPWLDEMPAPQLAAWVRDEHRAMACRAKAHHGEHHLVLPAAPRARRVDVNAEHVSWSFAGRPVPPAGVPTAS